MLNQARELAAVFRERAAECERLRRVPDETIEAVRAAGIVRLCQPRRIGGFEEGWDTLCEVSMELGHGDGAQAWVTNIYAEGSYMVALFPEQAQQEVWRADPSALVSSSISPVGNKVERVRDGFLLSGRWPFASGLHHSSWTVVGDLTPSAEDPAAPPAHHFFLIPAADRRVIDDWHTMGMAGTGSASFTLDRAFVPTHRALPHACVVAGEAPGTRINTNPIYRMPMYGFSFLALTSVPVGAVEAMTLEFGKYVGERAGRAKGAAVVPHLQSRLTEASVEARAARLLVLDAARENMAKLRAGDRLTAADAARTSRNGAYAAMLARRAASRMFEASGAHGIYLPGFMERTFRDVHAATVHAGLNWDAATVKYGRIASGLSPEPAPF